MRSERINLSNWHIGAMYSRAEIAQAGGVAAPRHSRDPHWSTGIVQFSNAVLLLVTLEKDTYNYLDYFDGALFWWQSQNQQTQASPVIQKLSTGELPAYLFVRLKSKRQGKALQFVYCGPLSTPIFDGAKPVTGLFRALAYSASPTPALAQIYQWHPQASISLDNRERMADLWLRHTQSHAITSQAPALAPASAPSAQESAAPYTVTPHPPPLSAAHVHDERLRVYANIVRRQGQPAFRKALLQAYAGRCAVTDNDVLHVLEAAHIYPYQGEQTNNTSNGLLLRADIHTLFDLFLLSVDPDLRTLCVAPSLANSPYATLHGQLLTAPVTGHSPPSDFALRWHRSQCAW